MARGKHLPKFLHALRVALVGKFQQASRSGSGPYSFTPGLSRTLLLVGSTHTLAHGLAIAGPVSIRGKDETSHSGC